jgi:Xaa-Pro aminopeptidase
VSVVPPPAELKHRLDRFREALDRRKLPAALITNDRNVRYLSGFAGGDSALLITRNDKILLTDFRYKEEAGHEAKGWDVVIEKIVPRKKGAPKIVVPRALMEKAGLFARKCRVKLMGVEPGEMCLAEMRVLRKATRGHTHLRSEDGMVGELRIFKSNWEVEQIEKALRIQEMCFNQLCQGLKEGMTERECAAFLRYLMVRAGAEDQAFPIMFQIGSNSSLPHGRTTDRALRGDNIILVDWGCRYNGYHSDLTRTFFLGSIPRRLREIHAVVMEAQKAAMDRIAPDVPMVEVDKAARDVISKAGYGKAFGHSTGHGIGLDIHEQPSLSQTAKAELQAGMVVTVEPGVYLPGVGGVRIEDDVLVTPQGNRVLSRIGKGLRWSGVNQ